jgi:outer membrane immunogenic protein
MKKFLLASVALAALGIGAPAIAADMGVRHYAPPPAFSWTGCHLGGLFGYSWGNDAGYTTTGSTAFLQSVPNTFTAVPGGIPATNNFSLSGFNGGADAGCDYQFGAWVVGVEGDWSVTNKEGQSQITPQLFAVGNRLGFLTSNTRFWEAQERWYATARGRVGYAVDKWLFFVSGGAAWMKIDSSEFNTAGVCCTTNLQSDRRSGWTVGAGVDYAPTILKGHWVIRAEYLYVQIDSYNTFTPGTGSAFTSPVAPTSLVSGQFTNLNNGRIQDHIVRFGLAYKFGAYSGSELYR